MIAALWIFVVFALGGCAGALLTALLRTAADQRFDELSLSECHNVSAPRREC